MVLCGRLVSMSVCACMYVYLHNMYRFKKKKVSSIARRSPTRLLTTVCDEIHSHHVTLHLKTHPSALGVAAHISLISSILSKHLLFALIALLRHQICLKKSMRFSHIPSICLTITAFSQSMMQFAPYCAMLTRARTAVLIYAKFI